MLLAMGKPLNITLHDDAETKVRAICSRRKMSMRGLMSQLAQWFAELNDDTLQALVLDQVAEEDREELLARALSRRKETSDEKKLRAQAMVTNARQNTKRSRA